MVMYESDTSEFMFTDGSIIQLSSCGANYRYIKNPLDYSLCKSQLCRYATSETKHKVDASLKLRNLFATRPYVMVDDCDKVVRVHSDRHVYWTNNNVSDKADSFVSKERNVESQCSPTLTMLKYLSQISYKRAKNTNVSSKKELVWVTNIFPTELPFHHWKSLNSETESVEELPLPYNKRCNKQYKHNWERFSDEQGDCTRVLKVFYCSQTFYWLLNNQKPDIIALLLNDYGSVLSSHAKNKFYYNYTKFTETSNTVERTFSSTNLPSDAAVKNVIMRANRLIMCSSNFDQNNRSLRCCDEVQSEEEKIPVLPNITELARLGRFSYAQNEVQISFADQTTLYCDVTEEIFDLLRANRNEAFQLLKARIFFADGKYFNCDSLFHASQHLQPYSQPCKDFLMWLLKSEGERKKDPFYRNTVHCSEISSLIEDELSKISKLSVEIDDVMDFKSDSVRGAVVYDVDDILKRNSEALIEIESILS